MLKGLKTASLIVLSSIFMSACITSEIQSDQRFTYKVPTECKLNHALVRNPLPATPHGMSLPEFGQGVIGWATGPEGAETRLENIQHSALKEMQDKGTTLAMIKEWKAFYENETLRNPCNPTAPYRAELMKKIAWMWVE